ncbi:MAG: hypothetical protein JSV03_00605, partial [Planctomycetota bacterium]
MVAYSFAFQCLAVDFVADPAGAVDYLEGDGDMSMMETIPVHVRPVVRQRSMFWNLLRKEWRESRGPLIVGLWTFWLMPAFLFFVYTGIAWDHELLPGIAWFTVAAAGWFYAIIIGAYTVCRDWGKPEEHFLFGRPVSHHAVIMAKFCAGVAVVGIVVSVAGLWDLGIAAYDQGWKELPDADDLDSIWFAITAICFLSIIAVGFCLAFAAAVITRQMLPSVLVAILVLLIWLAAPLLSNQLSFLYPAVITGSFFPDSSLPGDFIAAIWKSLGTGFLIMVTLSIILPVVIALLVAPRESITRIGIGQKTLAWTIALVVLGLFGAAMNEVGNSLTVTDRKIVRAGRRDAWPGGSLTARRGDRFFVISRSAGSMPVEEMWPGRQMRLSPHSYGFPMVSFRVDERGHITDWQSTRISQINMPLNMNNSYMSLHDFNFNQAGIMAINGDVYTVDGPGKHLKKGISRTMITWPAGGSPEVISHKFLTLGRDEEIETRILTDYKTTDRYAYLIYADFSPFAGLDKKEWDWDDCEHILYVFALEDGITPRPRYKITLASSCSLIISDSGKLEIRKRQTDSDRKTGQLFSRYVVVRFDADDPQSLIDTQPWTFEPDINIERSMYIALINSFVPEGDVAVQTIGGGE